MSAARFDALGAMDDAADDLDGQRMHSKTLREARAAVAELIEAGREVSETHEAFQRNPTRNTANAANKADGRLRAAIARVQGGQS